MHLFGMNLSQDAVGEPAVPQCPGQALRALPRGEMGLGRQGSWMANPGPLASLSGTGRPINSPPSQGRLPPKRSWGDRPLGRDRSSTARVSPWGRPQRNRIRQRLTLRWPPAPVLGDA